VTLTIVVAVGTGTLKEPRDDYTLHPKTQLVRQGTMRTLGRRNLASTLPKLSLQVFVPAGAIRGVAAPPDGIP
jgi:hypothetical protein